MKKTAAKQKSTRKASMAPGVVGKAILADLTEFAEALESGISLASKYNIRRVEKNSARSKIQRLASPQQRRSDTAEQ
jgi:hypothetical protein